MFKATLYFMPLIDLDLTKEVSTKFDEYITVNQGYVIFYVF